MRRRDLGRLLPAVALGALAAQGREAAAQPAPAIDALQSELRLRQGESLLLHRKVDLSGLRMIQGGQFVNHPLETARLTVVHVWAVECKPCVEELPLLRRMADSFRSSPQIKFVFVSETTDSAKLLAFLASHSAEMPRGDHFQITDGSLRASLQQNAQPTTLLLDPLGVVRQALLGSIKQRRSELADAIERLSRSL